MNHVYHDNKPKVLILYQVVKIISRQKNTPSNPAIGRGAFLCQRRHLLRGRSLKRSIHVQLLERSLQDNL